jgi:glycerol-1-phosphate dehydrogenase [NAD(P)+]
MTRDGLKISLPSRSADVIIGDTDILCQAPLHMMKAGLGDMLAKYVSICEWRIAHLICGEYYCEEIADLIRSALKRCADNAEGLLKRDPAAVEAVFAGLVIGGVAMNYAGLSRPASGVEHYISHVLDMRGAEYGTPVELHGIQCAIGTLIAASLYEKVKTITPDKEKGLAYAASFDQAAWNETLRQLLGKGAESMIALEAKEGKYDVAKHAPRLEFIVNNWDTILSIIEEEIPSTETLNALMDTIEAPKTLAEIGIDENLLPTVFRATKDIRDKYVLSRLAWDLGILDELI